VLGVKKIPFQTRSRTGLKFYLGRWRWMAYGFLCLLVLLFLFLPLGSLLREGLKGEALLFALENGGRALLRGLLYASLAAFSAALWAILALYSQNGRQTSWFTTISLGGFFLPPAIVASCLIYSFSRTPGLGLAYGTSLLLLQGLLVRFSFFAYHCQAIGFSLLPKGAWEAALLTGHGPWSIFRKIIFPQMRRWFFWAVILVFAFAVNELGLSVMLYPPGGEPLVVDLYTLSVNNPFSHSAALALLHSLGSFLMILVFLRWGMK
jgi:iron(III) transport system permease protein